MRRVLFAALIWVAGTVAAFAQCSTQLPGGTVCGNKGTALGLSGPLTSPVLGIPGVSQGSLGLAGTGGGSVTLQPSTAALGSSVATLRAGTYNVVGDTLANTFTAAQVITTNATALQAAQTGSVLRIASADGVSARYEADAYGATAYFSAVVSGGTNASRTALSSGTELGGFNVWGYNGTAFVGPRGAFRCYANQTWTTGANGTYCDVATTPNGATAEAETVRFENDGGITVPSTVTGGDKGAGTINAAGLFVNGVAVQTAAGTVTSVGTGQGLSGGPITTSGTLTTSAGVDANVLNARTSAYSLQTTDCGKTLSLGGGALYTLTVGAASGFPATCTVVVSNADTGRAKTMTINGVSFPNLGFLWPLQTFTLKNENNVWTIVNPPGRWVLPGSTVFNVSPSGSNSNDCLGTTTGACLTINFTSALISQVVDAANQYLQIQLDCSGAPTTYTASNRLKPAYGAPSGNNPSANINPTLTGSTSTPSNCVLTSSGGATLQLIGNSVWNVQGISLANTDGSSPCLLIDQQSWLRYNAMIFNSCNGTSGNDIVVEDQSGAEMAGNVTINNNAAMHVYSINQGTFVWSSGVITCNGALAITNFTGSSINSAQQWAGVTFSGCGSVTGNRYSATLGGGVNTNGGGATFFPGNAGGTATSPGWYN
jgi:hypothetical protein